MQKCIDVYSAICELQLLEGFQLNLKNIDTKPVNDFKKVIQSKRYVPVNCLPVVVAKIQQI